MWIDERMTLDEAYYEWRKEEEARMEEERDKKAYEMTAAAIGWAEDAAELWIPADIQPIKNGLYLTKNAYKCVHITLFYKGKWNGDVTGWLPVPEV